MKSLEEAIAANVATGTVHPIPVGTPVRVTSLLGEVMHGVVDDNSNVSWLPDEPWSGYYGVCTGAWPPVRGKRGDGVIAATYTVTVA